MGLRRGGHHLMTANKTVSPQPAYSVTDAHGKVLTVTSSSGGNMTLSNGASQVVLTKQNVLDLLTVLTNFGSSGAVT